MRTEDEGSENQCREPGEVIPALPVRDDSAWNRMAYVVQPGRYLMTQLMRFPDSKNVS